MSKTRFKLVAALLTCWCAAAAGGGEGSMPAAVTFVQEWKKQPSAPAGWIKLDEKSAHITGGKDKDVFILMTDGKNEMLVCFRKRKAYWEMSVLETVPTSAHEKYGVNPKDLRIFLENRSVLYGVEGSEAISLFTWDDAEGVFLGTAP